MVRWCLIFIFLSSSLLASPKEQLKKAFEETLLKKNYSALPEYYHTEMKLYTNGKVMDYQTYLETHKGMYNSEYKIEYDPDTFVEEGNKVAARLWLTQIPGKTIEVVLIVEFCEGKIYRLWELTYPDWQSALK